jgi:hypothetical protein
MSAAYIAGFVLAGIGGLIAFIGGLMIIIAAFRIHVGWGLGCIFVPFVSIVFIIAHWSEAKRGVLIWIPGIIIAGIAGGIIAYANHQERAAHVQRALMLEKQRLMEAQQR